MAHQDSLSFRTARSRSAGFKDASEELMQHHHQAMECRDCEAFMQMGIEAFQWAIRCDEQHRLEALEDESTWDQELADALENLFREWLEACRFRKEWIQEQVNRGFDVDNHAEFLECYEQVESIVESFDESELPKPVADLRDDALEKFRNGETAAFV